MRKLIAVAALGLTLALSACAPNGSTTTAPEPAPTQTTASQTPTPTPTVRVAERVVFEGTAAYDDLAAVYERGDIPVMLLPAVLGATITITGVPTETWHTESFLRIYEDGGALVIHPQSKYDAFKDPQDFVGQSSGTIRFSTDEGEFSVEIEGVQP